MQKDFGKYLGSAMMIGFGLVAAYRFHQTHLMFFLLLVLRDFAAGYFFLKRKSSVTRGSHILSVLAYVSSAMPLLYFSPVIAEKSVFLVTDFLAIAGFLIVVFATLELGTSIGIAPANRGLVRSGIYRHIKHPMYLGYGISEAGFLLLNPLNAALFLISISLYIIRGKSENKLLS